MRRLPAEAEGRRGSLGDLPFAAPGGEGVLVRTAGIPARVRPKYTVEPTFTFDYE